MQDGDSSGGAGTASDLSPSEEWEAKFKDITGLVEKAKKCLTTHKHFEAMGPLVGPGRDMSADEREGWGDKLEELRSLVQDAGEHLRKLRYRPTVTEATTGGIDEFDFGTETGCLLSAVGRWSDPRALVPASLVLGPVPPPTVQHGSPLV